MTDFRNESLQLGRLVARLRAGSGQAGLLGGGAALVGNIAEVMPMSPLNAPAVCCRRLGWLAFQPKRPSGGTLFSWSQTMLGRPEMPSPSRSSGSARARRVSSGTASSRPSPTRCGPTRGDIITSGASGP